MTHPQKFYTCGDCCIDGKHLSYEGAAQCERSRTALEIIDRALKGEVEFHTRTLLNIVQWPLAYQHCTQCSHAHVDHRYGFECFKCDCKAFTFKPVGWVGAEEGDD